MTPILRKRHFRIWIVLSVVLPMAFIWAYTVIPSVPPPTERVQHHALPIQLTQIEKEIDHEKLKINLRKGVVDSVEVRQLEVIVKAPLMHPSTWIYVGEDGKSVIAEQKLLGVLANQGVYRFSIPIDMNIATISLYDAIKKERWENIEIK